jgi:hypothetical protein
MSNSEAEPKTTFSNKEVLFNAGQLIEEIRSRLRECPKYVSALLDKELEGTDGKYSVGNKHVDVISINPSRDNLHRTVNLTDSIIIKTQEPDFEGYQIITVITVRVKHGESYPDRSYDDLPAIGKPENGFFMIDMYKEGKLDEDGRPLNKRILIDSDTPAILDKIHQLIETIIPTS